MKQPTKEQQEQINKIKGIFTKTRRCPDTRIGFGKYKGMLLENIIKTKDGYQYLQWLCTEEDITGNSRLCANMEKAIKYAEEEYGYSTNLH